MITHANNLTKINKAYYICRLGKKEVKSLIVTWFIHKQNILLHKVVDENYEDTIILHNFF